MAGLSVLAKNEMNTWCCAKRRPTSLVLEDGREFWRNYIQVISWSKSSRMPSVYEKVHGGDAC